MNIHLRTHQNVLSAAVIGAGVFGRFHASKYLRLPGVKLAAFADPSLDARRLATSGIQVPAVADWHDLLGQVDMVSICTPASTHAEIVRAFLKAGAHVLVEKPIATDLEEAEELIALAASRGRVLTVGHQERFVFARSGLLDYEDAPLCIECTRAGPWTGRGADVSVVLDLMIHDLDLVHQLVGARLRGIRTDGRSVYGEFLDEANAHLTFEGGTSASLFASRASDTRKRSMRLVYPDGEIEVDFLARTLRNTTKRPLRPLELADPLGESVAAFVNAARAGVDSLVRPEEARRALETALLIEESLLLTGEVKPVDAEPVRLIA